MNLRPSFVTCLLAALVGLAAAGCSVEPLSAEGVQADMSPELHTVALTKQQRNNRAARTTDTNGRQAWDDIDNVLLLDRPLSLSRYPIP